MSFVNASEKEEIASKLQETEEWLYEEGDDESEKVYLRKMEELKKVTKKTQCFFMLTLHSHYTCRF